MARRRKKRKQAAPGWAWMLLGLSMGLAIALVVYLRSEGPALVEPLQAARSATTSPAPPSQPVTTTVRAEPAPEPQPAGNSSSDDSGSAAGLGFYEELGQIEVEVPAIETLTREALAEDIEYIIQAGSFRTLAEADRRKARLALLGYESEIRRTIVTDAVWFRVIIGPLRERGEISSVRRRLSSENIDSMPPQPVSGN